MGREAMLEIEEGCGLARDADVDRRTNGADVPYELFGGAT
jgi:hypothetical protein